MEPSGSLPCSQQLTTGPQPWTTASQSTPSHTIHLRSILILSSHRSLPLLRSFFPSHFRTKNAARVSKASNASYITCPSQSPQFDTSNNSGDYKIRQDIFSDIFAAKLQPYLEQMQEMSVTLKGGGGYKGGNFVYLTKFSPLYTLICVTYKAVM